MIGQRMVADDVLADLEGIVGRGFIRTAPGSLAGAAVAGIVPAVVVSPAGEDEISAVLALANDRGLGVVPFGTGTRQHVGASLSALRPFLRLDLARLDQVLAYEPADLTVTVQAGLTLGALQARLAASGQWLPLDPPAAADATLGGLVATADSGPHRLRYGTPRDLLIGFRAVLADGLAFTGGAKVVKNVSGYDLPRLLCGSLGTLAVLTELTFKLQPLPAHSATVGAEFAASAAAESAARRLLNSPLRPVACELLSRAGDGHAAATGTGAVRLDIRFSDDPLPLERALGDARKVFQDGEARGVEVLRDAADAGRWRFVADRVAGLRAPETALVKIAVLPTRLPSAVAAAEAYGGVSWQARLGTGLLFVAVPAVEAALVSLRQAVSHLGGTLVVLDAPSLFRTPELVWGPPRADFTVMKALKRRFDPRDVLNPGRFVGGL